MMKLHITQCNECKTKFLVGIDGKDIRKAKVSGSSEGTMPFFAISNDELEKAPKIDCNTKIPCRNCGNLCTIISK